jgi:S-adenosylmethionine-diacylgycerolhomoserine-N-methlytransferase
MIDDLPAAPKHTALMDDIYRHQRYVYDFTRKYYLLGRDRLIRDLGASPGESVVEVGCGTGRNLVKMARHYPDVTFYGLDASLEMLKTAELAIRRAGLSGRIQLAHGLAEDLSPAMFGTSLPFNHAIFSYSLSMIPNWKQALRRAADHSTSKVHIVDFGDMDDLWPPAARLMRLWLRLFHVTPREEILRKLELCRPTEEPWTALRILPAHYAFIWQGHSKAVQSLAL